MPAVKQRAALRIANLTAFLRFEAGLVQGQEPQEDNPSREKRLRRQVEKLQSALTDNRRRLDEARWQLRNSSRLPKRWFWTVYIVSDKHRFVFLGTHKVATTSVLISLLPFFDFDVEGENFDNLKRGPTFKRNGASIGGVHELFSGSPYQINKAHFLAGMGNEYHRYFKFAFVRNPWDRLVSCYWSKIRGEPRMRMGEYGDVSLRSDMTFKEFAEAVCQIPDEISNTHFRSQHVTVCDDGPEKNILADFVGRFENLEEDFGFVAKKIGLDNTELTHFANSKDSKTRPYRDSYDEKLARMVGERYREDANLFDYSF